MVMPFLKSIFWRLLYKEMMDNCLFHWHMNTDTDIFTSDSRQFTETTIFSFILYFRNNFETNVKNWTLRIFAPILWPQMINKNKRETNQVTLKLKRSNKCYQECQRKVISFKSSSNMIRNIMKYKNGIP